MLEIYAYDIRNLLIKSEYETRLAAASDYRREKIDNSKVPAKAMEQLASAAVLDDALKKVDLREKEIEYGFGEAGKPYIKGTAGDAAGYADTLAKDYEKIHFNISHSGDYAVCAISDREVGIDIQKIETPKLQVAKRFFAKNEYEYITNQPDEKSKMEAFYRIWTLKESYVKAIGVGTNLPFDSFEFDVSGESVCLKEDTGCKVISNKAFFERKKYSFEELNLSQTHFTGKSEDELYKISVCIIESKIS